MIQKDKLLHMAVGLAVALFALVLWTIASAAGLAPLSGAPAAAALAALVAGITKEGADHLDNRLVPKMHGVEWLDAAATTLPGVLLGIAAHVLMQHL